MIKYLLDNKDETRKIWQEVFKEDTENFLDYYYKYKNIDNKLICKFVDEKIASMIHLNPYKLCINDKFYKSYYIVAVATLEEHRKKGYMAELLNKSIKDMYKENVPFTFLRPAKKEIYLPFDFEYIYNHNFLALNKHNFKEVPISENNYEEIANFTNEFLKKRYNTFCVRDFNYIKTLHQEVKSENGYIVMLYDNNDFLGYYVYWGVKEKTTRAIFLDDKFTSIEETKPLVMARIVNLYEFFKNFSLKDLSCENVNLYLNIKDNIIKENNGYFKLNISKNSSLLEALPSINKEDLDKVFDINIKDLLSVFFGYKNINEFTQNKYVLNSFNNINLLDKVFIDEEV